MSDSDPNPSEKQQAFHWFIQGFRASREGYNAEVAVTHSQPTANRYSVETEPSKETLEQLREHFENVWNDSQ